MNYNFTRGNDEIVSDQIEKLMNNELQKQLKPTFLFEEMVKEQVERINLWDSQSDNKLIKMVEMYNEKNWDKIAGEFPKFDQSDCLLRYRSVFQIKCKKGPWNEVEDKLLISAVKKLGNANSIWNSIAMLVPGRNSKQCRERWRNQLDPEIDRSPITEEEDRLLIEKIAEIGNKWCKLSTHFKGRPDNMLKNHWYSVLYPRVLKEQKQKKTPSVFGKRVAKSDIKKLTRRTKKKKINSQYYPTFSTRKRTFNKDQNESKDGIKGNRAITRSQRSQKRRLLKQQSANIGRNTNRNLKAKSQSNKKTNNNKKKTKQSKKRFRVVIKKRRNQQKQTEQFSRKLKGTRNEKSKCNKQTFLIAELQSIDTYIFQTEHIKTDHRSIKNEPKLISHLVNNNNINNQLENENFANIENLMLKDNQFYYIANKNINNTQNITASDSNKSIYNHNLNEENYVDSAQNNPKLVFLENTISNDFNNLSYNPNTNSNSETLCLDECIWDNGDLINDTMTDLNSWDLFQYNEYFD
ncbi:myb protein-related [Anaeramoeba flamelloides]|uniref:Myb protein-related n=1 Tax=Anaeramoeba flamelloides TaxID=1746091 RepID=A0AAV7ZWV8_9EUKA|nr:myb protein-related [Anaeramoeba flamelloides]